MSDKEGALFCKIVKGGGGRGVSPINVIPTTNVIRINHKCDTDHKCNNF